MTDVPKPLAPREAAERAARGEIDLVDVRELDEWRSGHAPAAHHIPLSTLPARLGDLSREHPVAFVCQSGGRSMLAAQLAAREGIEVLDVDGGMIAWRAAGLDVTGEEPGSAA